MNHSCDANMYCPYTDRTVDRGFYDSFAMKDIEIGDEITSDYACFDYECDGHEIEECGCGSDKCRGKMMGFKHLLMEQKIRLYPYCDSDVRR